MTLRSPFVMNPEFDTFLYAAICAENAGSTGAESSEMPTTVISALTRLNIDPWQEAARLSNLPKDKAAAAICLWIGKLPDGGWKPSDVAGMAARLANLLPRGSTASPRAQDDAEPLSGRKAGLKSVLWLAALAVGAVMLFSLITHQGGAPDKDRAMRPPVSGLILPGE